MKIKHTKAGHFLAFGAELVTIIATSALWIWYLQTGRPLDGWTAGVTVIFVPFLLLIFGVLWLIIRLLLQRFLVLAKFANAPAQPQTEQH